MAQGDLMSKNPAMASQLSRPLAQEPESFLHSLLAAQDISTLAFIAVRQLHALGLRQAQLVWNHEPSPSAPLHTSNDVPLDPASLALLETARRQGGRAQRDESGAVHLVQVLAQNTGLWVALSVSFDPARADPEWQAKMAPLSVRCQSLLYTQRLQVDVERLANAERLQHALFAISDIASSDRSTADVLHSLHQIVGSLMYPKNFYIVRFDPERQTIRFLYFADSHDPDTPDPDEELSPQEMSNSLTLALLRHGKPVRGPSEQLRSRLGVPRDDTLGPDSEDWMGVPIVEDGVVLGAVVVQSYDPAVRYSETDQALLGYVAQHILSALSRRDAQEELERRVEARTLELRKQIHERQRSEQLQRALYRITELSVSSESMQSFYASVHEIVGELLDARNFYIALLTEDGSELEFPYSVDERDLRQRTRKLGRGLSEYVLRTGEPLLADRANIEGLEAKGEVLSVGTKSVCWLGVPLMIDGKARGLITVQSYSPDYLYSP